MAAASPRVEQYFQAILDKVDRCYTIANTAKACGYDPDPVVRIPLAKNMAERVEGLISSVAPEIVGKGVPQRIHELESIYGNQDWRVALLIAEEVANGKFCSFSDQRKAIEVGIRVGFAYVTVGVVSSPLEGFISLQIRKRKDTGKEYFALVYAGPIRSAGGTGASVSVLIADYIRVRLGYDLYDPTEDEIKRATTELYDYHERVTNLQYLPSEEEIRFLILHLPVQIDGDPSEDYEVSNYKNLDRRLSNKISNGFCLVVGECLALKAPKLWKQLSKWGKDLGVDHWKFLEEFIWLQKEIRARGTKIGNIGVKEKVTPDTAYIKDIVAGRPVLTYPLRNGGFRLRYGRARVSGFSSDAVHPATMLVLENFIAIGTQLKTERPGKSTVLNVCDSIDGPIVKMRDGSVKILRTYEEAFIALNDIEEILYLGDLLINWGDFLNRAHKLLPCGFVPEWWIFYAEKVFDKVSLGKDFLDQLKKDPLQTKVTFDQAMLFSDLGIPLYPAYIFYWSTLSTNDFLSLYKALQGSVLDENKIVIPILSVKRYLELIGCEHTLIGNEYLVVSGDTAKALCVNLGDFQNEPVGETTLERVNSISRYVIKDLCGTFIGARMGRPEKAKMRELTGKPHVLFPVGEEGGRLRAFHSSLEAGHVRSNFPTFFCHFCQHETIYAVCEVCGNRTKRKWYCKGCSKLIDFESCSLHGPSKSAVAKTIDIKHYFYKALEKLGSRQYPELIKGVRGLSSIEQIPEHLTKGILRAKYALHINKDGTVRYDMTELPMTHFKPREIGTSVDILHSLGYEKDIYGNMLESDDQVVELLPQDVVLPSCPESPDEGADDVLFRVAGFIDELLVKLYGLEQYYSFKSKKDLVGHLIIAISPHTSAGMVCRIIGFSQVQGFYAHPLLHSILRRDCDGDEAGCMLLLDTLLNFSRVFLPNTRGVTQDAPLVLTAQLIPSEVDDMVFDIDVVDRYPLELYEAAENYRDPSTVPITKFGNYLGTEKQYEGILFTHPTTDINFGVRCSAYKTLPTMEEKVKVQMRIAKKIRAVDEDDVARLIIERHFLRDIKGNLRKFSQQGFRCVHCNEIYRRPPLTGVCMCGGKLVFTVSEGSIVKYLDPAMTLAKKYNLPPYLQQTLLLLKCRIEGLFGKEAEKQEGLHKWFNSS